jgi:hypothetical protein
MAGDDREGVLGLAEVFKVVRKAFRSEGEATWPGMGTRRLPCVMRFSTRLIA